MDIRNLEIFVHVAELGGFNRAAAQLHIAQSALSRRVAILEHEIGVQLLVRSKRGVKLTPAGAVLLERARTLLEDFQKTTAQIFADAGVPRGTVKLGFPPSLVSEAADVLESLHSAFPELHLQSWVATTVELNRMLLENKLDLAVFAAIESDPQFEVQELFSDRLFLIGAKSVALAARASWKQIASLPLILPSAPNSVRRMADAAAAKHGVHLNVEMDVNDVSLILRLVAMEAGYTILPQSALRADSKLFSCAVVPGLRIHWVAAWLRDRPFSAATMKIIDTLRAIASGDARNGCDS